MNHPTVLAIGSCRIFRPLRRLHDEGRINLVNYTERYWFTHTAAAALQYVDVMQGRVAVPPELRRAALETELVFPADMALGIGEVDLVVVEVSSLKQHRIGAYELNAHKVYGIAVETGHPHQPIVNGHREALDALPEGHILHALKVDYTSPAQLASDLTSIRKQVGAPVMTVDHLHAVLPDGGSVPGRDRLTEDLRAVSMASGLSFYSTKDLIDEHGSEVALLDQNHYRSEFEAVVGERMLPMILASAAESQARP